VTRRYEVNQKLGKGAYGIVWNAQDKKTKETVALKKIFDAFQNSTDSQRTYREVVYLLQMKHENIIRLQQVLMADNDKDIYLVFEYMETDLHATIRANILEDIHKQYIMYQSFKALKYMHSADIVHRDMKPANLLLSSECLMKVADFGLARTLSEIASEGKSDVMTDYVATRWYRAPEILVGSQVYGFAVDLWSLGCILGEMLNGKPVFSGSSTLNQLETISELLGHPTDEDLEGLKSAFAQSLYRGDGGIHLDEEKEARLANSTLQQRFTEKFPTASPEALQLLMALLVYHPAKRLTTDAGLVHPYCIQFSDTASEIAAKQKVGTNPEDAEQGYHKDAIANEVNDNNKLKTQQYREMLSGICKAQTEKPHRKG